MARPRTYTPAEAAERDRRSKAASSVSNRAAANIRRNARRERYRALEARLRKLADAGVDAAFAIVNAQQMLRPNLLYIDARGHVHQEIWETAEELIDRLSPPKNKRRRPCEKHAKESMPR